MILSRRSSFCKFASHSDIFCASFYIIVLIRFYLLCFVNVIVVMILGLAGKDFAPPFR